MNSCLSKQEVIRRKAEFQDLYTNGGLVKGRLFILRWRAGNSDERRVAFAAGKKLGCAVIRNRCKRLLRECYRLHKNDLPDNCDYMFVARQALLKKKLHDVELAWDKIILILKSQCCEEQLKCE